MAVDWKMLTCEERVNQKGLDFIGEVCGQKFGRAARLREHQKEVHGKKFATEEQNLEALQYAKQLVSELLSNSYFIGALNMYDSLADTEQRGWMTARLRCFLDEPAIKDLD